MVRGAWPGWSLRQARRDSRAALEASGVRAGQDGTGSVSALSLCVLGGEEIGGAKTGERKRRSYANQGVYGSPSLSKLRSPMDQTAVCDGARCAGCTAHSGRLRHRRTLDTEDARPSLRRLRPTAGKWERAWIPARLRR